VKIYRVKSKPLAKKATGQRPSVDPYTGTKQYTGEWNLCYKIKEDGSVDMSVVGKDGEGDVGKDGKRDESYHRGTEIGAIMDFFKVQNPMLSGEFVKTQSAPHSHSHTFTPPTPSDEPPPREGVPSVSGIQEIEREKKLQ